MPSNATPAKHLGLAFYLAPWRLITLYAGTALLCIGADIYKMQDWDGALSFLMAGLTYLFAPWTVHVLVSRQWLMWPLAAFATWLAVDGSYVGLNEWLAREYYRRENFTASLPLYFLVGMFWYYGEAIWQRLRQNKG